MERSNYLRRFFWLSFGLFFCQPMCAQELGHVQANATQLACYQPLFVQILVEPTFEDPYDPKEISRRLGEEKTRKWVPNVG